MRKKSRPNKVESHFHPRSLARSIVHARMANSDMFGVNKVHPGQTKSTFSKTWRIDADRFAADAK